MNQRGYTLPELLVTIVLMIGLAIGAYFLVHPKNYDAQSQDAERRTGIAFIVQSLNRYHANQGHLPEDIQTAPAFIGSGSGNVDLCKDLVPKYAVDLPLDPILSATSMDGRCNVTGQTYLTGYTVWRSPDGRTVSVRANQSNGTKITVSQQYAR